MELAISPTFTVLFPKYIDLVRPSKFETNQSIEHFIQNELPLKVEMVKKLETTFSSFLAQYSSLIVKRPQVASLSYSLANKATELLDKTFKDCEMACQKSGKEQISSCFEDLLPRKCLQTFRSRMKDMEETVRSKYISNPDIPREEEEGIAERLYKILEIYHFVKSDLVTLASKHRVQQDRICDKAFNQGAIDVKEWASFVGVEEGFEEYINSVVQKRCRPFHNKKDFFNSKIRESLREAELRCESKNEPSFLIFIESLLSKERNRIMKLTIPKVQNILRSVGEVPEETGCRDIGERVEVLKRKFMEIKNNSYYIDMIRGDFSRKYKMELGKLENLYYLSNIEKYLQDVASFVADLMKLEETILDNRKSFKTTLNSKVEYQLRELCEGDRPNIQICDILNIYFDELEKMLLMVSSRPQDAASYKPSYRNTQESQDNARKNREEQQRYQEEERRRRAEAEAQQRRAKEQERKAAEESRRLKEKQEQERKRQKYLQDKAQKQKRDEQKRKIEEEERRKRADQMAKRQKELQQKRRLDQDKKKMEQKQRKEVEEQKKREQNERKKKEDEDRKRKMEELEKAKKEEDERKRKQLQIKKKKDQEDRLRKQEEDRKKRELELQKKNEQAERLRIKKQQEDRKKKESEEKKRKEDEQKRKKQEEEQKLKQLEEKKRKQEEDRKKKEAQEKRKKDEEERLKKQLEDKKKKDEDEKRRKQQEEEKKKKLEEETRKKQVEDKKRKQQEDRKRKQEQDRKRKQQEDRKKRELEEKERQRKQQEEERKRQQEEKKRKDAEQKKRKQDEEKKKLQQKKKKEEDEKRKKEEQDRKKKEAEEKQRKRKEEEEAQKKLETEKKLAQEKEKKQKQEQKRKQEQEAKAKKGGKNEPKKSAINYGDLEDELIDQDQDIKKPQKGIPQKNKKEDDQYLQEYDDDFDDFSPDKQEHEQQGQGQGLKPQPLIMEQNLKCLNQYMKGTSYARKNKPNLEEFNNRNQYAYLFEEFTQNQKLYIYSDCSIAKAIYDFGKELEDDSVPEQFLTQTLETIQTAMIEDHMKTLDEENLNDETRIVLPFSFKNDLNIYLVEVQRPEQAIIIVFREAPPQSEQFQFKIQNFIEAFRHLYGLEEPQVESVVVPPETVAVLDTFDKELPLLLLIFALHYEQEHDLSSPIVVNQYTIERFFYISHTLKPLYEMIENEEEKIAGFYAGLGEKYGKGPKLQTLFYEIDINEDQENYDAKIAEVASKFKQDFLASSGAKHHFAMIQLLNSSEEEEASFRKIVIYFSMNKEEQGKPTLNYFLVSANEGEEQFATRMFEWVSGDIDAKFETTVYMDYTRHNGLSEYSEWTLSLWPHVVEKRKMSPLQAFRAITFAMTPYYVAVKQLD